MIRRIYTGGELVEFEEKNIKGYHVINEIVIDRGPSPYAN